MKTHQRIEELLREALDPISLEISDESAAHAGHVGNPNGDGETHWFVCITSEHFTGLSQVQRHRLVYHALDKLLHNRPIHALRLKTLTPEN